MFALLLALGAGRLAAQNRDALRQIVQEQCMVHLQLEQVAAPCLQVVLPPAPQQNDGYAVLADRKGGAHFLLIPTRTISGLESPPLLEPDAPNYFAAAWAARVQIAAYLGHEVNRDAIGLAVNSARARSQDQFHIHIECLRPEVIRDLRAAAETLGPEWSPLRVDGWPYQALKVMGADLGGANPVALLAERLPGARASLRDYTLIVAGMQFSAGPGFVVLSGTEHSGELLLDSSCAAAASGAGAAP